MNRLARHALTVLSLGMFMFLCIFQIFQIFQSTDLPFANIKQIELLRVPSPPHPIHQEI